MLLNFFILPCAAALSLFVSKCFYNRYLHPLSRFPGPFWGSVTDFYKAFTINSVPTKGLRLHKQYGPIIRLAPNLLSFSDPRLLPDVYHPHADKTTFYSSWLFGKTVGMFQNLDHKKHAVMAKAINPCCSLKALRKFEPTIDEHIVHLCEQLERTSQQEEYVDFTEYLRYWLADVYSHIAYGKPVGCVAQGRDVGGLITALKSTYSMVGTVAVLPWLLIPIINNFLFRILVLPYLQATKGIQMHIDNYDLQIQSHATSDKRETAPSRLFDPLVHNPSIPPDLLRTEHILFTSAALDGLAAFISPFIDRVTSSPSILTRLNTEILSASLSSPPTYEETLILPYFSACINETLRFESPVQTILPRYVSKDGMTYRGLVIPEATEMAASPYIIHRDPKVFGEDAEVFRPERWLLPPLEGIDENDRSSNSRESQQDESRRAVQSRIKDMEKFAMWWGYGSRTCAGKNLAQLQMRKLCLEILRRFEIKWVVDEKGRRFRCEPGGVGMFWGQRMVFNARATMS